MKSLKLNPPLIWTVMFLAAFAEIAHAGPYAPAAGQPGSTAIAHDDPRIVSWVTSAMSPTIDYGDEMTLPDAEFSNISRSFGPAKSSEEAIFDILSLGKGGEYTLTFDNEFAPAIYDGEGADFVIFENSFSDNFLELAQVWVSDGSLALNGSGETLFLPFDHDSLTSSPVNAFGTLDPTNINGLAGKYRGGFGTPFDLSDLNGLISDIQQGFPGFSFDLNNITQIKIVDVVGDGSVKDTSGDPIYDPYPTSGSIGFDLDAVGFINVVGGPPDPIPLEKQVPIPPLFLMIQAALLLGVLRGRIKSTRVEK